MKKRVFTVGLILSIISSMTLTSCLGSFALTSKVFAWNKQVSNKFVNELVFISFWILPVYEITSVSDLIILNTIEFWSGKNPALESSTKIIDGKDARYKVERNNLGYIITNLNDKSTVKFNFDELNNSWSFEANGKSTTFMTYVDDMHVKMITPDGDYKTIELSDAGLYAYREIASQGLFAKN